MNRPSPDGADWLARDRPLTDIRTPEGASEDTRAVRRTAAEFVARDVIPADGLLAGKHWATARALLSQAGTLGLIGVDAPQSEGGVGLDLSAALAVSEVFGAAPSFATIFGAQAGLSLVPILHFGTPAQRARYASRLIAGDLVGAYALSEAEAGSDAFSARTAARQAADGTWILSGEKTWTTNGGFADLFVVFAKTSADALSVFLVERDFPGVRTGSEEHKLGLDGSSTTAVRLDDARVPPGNLLGAVGDGKPIALATLNYGRLKLAATCLGMAKVALSDAARYAATRRQFGRQIASFGIIRHKLAQMAIRIYAVEAALSRTAGLIDGAAGVATDRLSVVGAFATEASILKVAASELIGGIADELVQIHGGNGFVRGYLAERLYRDARVFRIFEGTNEINRLVIVATARKREALFEVTSRVEEVPPSIRPAKTAIRSIKGVARGVLGRVCGRDGRIEDQELGMFAADLVAGAFLAESAVLRAEQAETRGHPLASLHADVAAAAAEIAWLDACRVMPTITAFVENSGIRMELRPEMTPVDTITLGRRVAHAITAGLCYPFA